MTKPNHFPESQAGIRQIEYDFFDPFALAETVTNAEIEIVQLNPGPFHASISSFVLPGSELVIGTLNQAYQLRGTYPCDEVMFSFWFPGADPMRTKGVDFTPTETLVFGQNNAEMEMVSKGLDHYGTFAFGRSEFFELAESVHDIDASVIETNELLISDCQTDLDKIRQTAREIESLAHQFPDLFLQQETQSHFKELLANQFLEILECHGRTTSETRPPNAWQRRQFLKKATELMQVHRGEVISLVDLCRAANASKRSLQYTFQEEYDMSPMKYLKINRLNQARRELLQNTIQSTNVTTVAFRNGCYHLGRFAIEYRTLFGERPSATLHRRPT